MRRALSRQWPPLPKAEAQPAYLSSGCASVLQVWGGQFSLPADGTSPRGSWAQPVCFLPRHTGRPSRSQICFPRESGPEAALWTRTSRTRCWRSSGGARALTHGEGASPAGSACDGSQPSCSNKVLLVATVRACVLRALPPPRAGARRVCRPVGLRRARPALNRAPPNPQQQGGRLPWALKSP